MTKKALANTSSLASIGLQAIETQKARRAWLDAVRANGLALKEFVTEVGESYVFGTDDPDPVIEETYAARRAAAKESLKQARKLRAAITRYLEERA
ncbi:hypothetical protein [Paraburkholderia sp. BCC1885]|uniref:hypothetical protein n=1 Tax=Paraburkholderia sp. BCC1885 TaxID=2562669 RepID=UPI0011834C37|nr:hypothetical protein [Paraburkholderia sp. BCC1885]